MKNKKSLWEYEECAKICDFGFYNKDTSEYDCKIGWCDSHACFYLNVDKFNLEVEKFKIKNKKE